MNRVPITISGARRLRGELQRLKTNDRPRIIKAIAEARAHGDLRENAEYHAAKEQQSFIEGRIQDVGSALADAELIDTSRVNANGKVVFGTQVIIMRIDNGEEQRYQIVGEIEADIDAGLISVTSPLARALIGKQEGDVAVVVAPDGKVEYEIIDVEYI